jgi:hypothetical protein
MQLGIKPTPITRYPNGGAAGRRKNSSGNDVHRRGGSSGGWRRRVWGPAAPVQEGKAGVSSNLGMMELRGRSPERGKTAVALDEI